MESNNIIKSLNEIFEIYAENQEFLTKLGLFRILFENRLIDICEFDIFTINHLFDQLKLENNVINKDSFSKLIFFIYTLQIRHLKSTNNDTEFVSREKEDKEFQEDFPEEITDMSYNSIKSIVTNRQLINSNYNLLKVLIDQIEKDKQFYDLCFPLLNEPGMSILVSDNIIQTLEMYYKSIYEDLFLKYAKEDIQKNIKYINILDFNQMVFDIPIFSTLNCQQISSTIRKFLAPQKIDDEKDLIKMLESVFDERQTAASIKNHFDYLYIYSSEFNFTFSAFVLICAKLAMAYKEDSDPIEAITYYFSDILSLTKDKGKEQIIIEETIVSEDSDYLPESNDFLQAQILQGKPEEEDEIFIQDFLGALDKELPEIPQEIISMKNDISLQANTLYYNPIKSIPVKFPLETLKVEIEEDKEKKIAEKEKNIIKNAKKKLRTNNKDPPAIPSCWWEPLPDVKSEESKYFGSKKIYDLKQRFFKNSYKEILPNSNVYPCLINELLIIPRNIPENIIEIILTAYKEQNLGNYEMAIRKLEKAQRECINFKVFTTQVQLFFELTFGAIYDCLDYRLMAMKYYFRAKNSTEKFYQNDPDSSLIYAFLGKILINLREYGWAFRCFFKCKSLRENSIGGDSIDTATIYNNLGVCCYYMQCFYPAYGYFQLSYEIYKKSLGIFHTRTMTIKDNLCKMSQLNFNKPFEYKKMCMYHTSTLEIVNKKKQKK